MVSKDDDIPELLRRRVLKQRKRLKIVRFTFALTAALSVVLLFGANQTATLAPTSRSIEIISVEPLWLLDQHLDLGTQKGNPNGSFGLVKVEDKEAASAPRYEGLARGAVRIKGDTFGITTSARFMLVELNGDDWERKALDPLGINDASASPTVFQFRDELWICWMRGSEVMVKPFNKPNVEPKALHKTSTSGVGLRAKVFGDAVWLSVRQDRTGALTLISFTPASELVPTTDEAEKDADEVPEPAEADTGDDVAPPPPMRTTVKRHLSLDVADNVRRSDFTVIAGRPVVGISKKEEAGRPWSLLLWKPGTGDSAGEWIDVDAPPRENESNGLELSSFLALADDKGELLAVYNDRSDIKSITGKMEDDAIIWGEPSKIAIDKTSGATAYIIWVSILFGMLLIMASQGVWLLLNRERAMDRTLAEILERQDQENSGGDPKKKAIPRLLYANALARAASLLLDVALTSPIIILLQGVYGYTWEQAYGFLAFGSLSDIEASILPVVQATIVTLLVLAIYGMICELIWGRTFGKALFRLRVVDSDGEPPATWRIVVRNALKIVELIHWTVLLIPLGLMMMTGKQQRLGDLLAGTYVIVELVPEETPDDMEM